MTRTEKIVCPKCLAIQTATVESFGDFPFEAYVHHCECGYIITESEWERAK